MNILYIGDIMGEPGIKVVEKVLPSLVVKHEIDFVIAQAENVSRGKGMLPIDMKRLQSAGIHFFTGGNHTPKREELFSLLEDPNSPVVGPANMRDCPGPGWKLVSTHKGRLLVVSVLGETFGNNPPAIDNPLHVIDAILETNKDESRIATVVNFHGDFSSQKRVFGYYLDGKVTAVIGDHWHVPTADAMILPKGTAHITDVGMCGTLHSSLGVSTNIIIKRWRDGSVEPNMLDSQGPFQFNALLVKADTKTGLAKDVEHVQRITE